MKSDPVLTKNQQIVWNALRASRAPLSAYALLDKMGGANIKAPLQVYRALDKLVAYGLVHRIECLHAFVVCSHRHDEPDRAVGFAICDDCGVLEEFLQPDIGRGLVTWSEQRSFAPRATTVEMRGLGKTCRGERA